MSISQHQTFAHWNYFRCLEDDVSHLSRWIELSEQNFHCYSIELARLLMTASAEVDVLAKLVCRMLQPMSEATSIHAYQDELTEQLPGIDQAKVEVPRHGLMLTPWSSWRQPRTPPLWWQANNKVKHHRSEHFQLATLENVLNAIAAQLLLLVLYYGPNVSVLAPMGTLFFPRSLCVRVGNDLEYMPNHI